MANFYDSPLNRIEISFQKISFPFSILHVSYRVLHRDYSTYREYSRWKFFFSFLHARQKKTRYDFTDHKYFFPAILSINRKIKKNKRRQYIHHQRAENESQNLLYLRSRGPSIFLRSTLPAPPPPHSQHEQFLFLRVSCAFYFIPRPPPPSRKSVFRPLTSIKPKACCIPRFSSPAGRSRGHFDRANCLNPRALFAKLCTVPRKLSPPFHSSLSPLIERLPPPSFTAPFSTLLFFPSREFDSSRFYERHGWRRGGKQGGGSVWSTGNRKELKRDETRRWRVGHREWFCSKIYPLLRLSFLKTYLILSGKIWK